MSKWREFWYGGQRAQQIEKQQVTEDISDAIDCLCQVANPEQVIAAAIIVLTRVSVTSPAGYDTKKCADARNVLEELSQKGFKRKKANGKRNRSVQNPNPAGT